MSEPFASAAALADQRPRDWMKRAQIEGLAALIVGGGSGMGAHALEPSQQTPGGNGF